MHKIKPYKQTTYETCLSCCLLQAVDRIKPIQITRRLELKCIIYSLKHRYSMEYIIGNMEFVANKFNARLTQFVESKYYFDYLQTLTKSKNIETKLHKIDLKFIDEMIEYFPIINVDDYHLYYDYHYPHFLTILEKRNNKYRVFDVWDGKEKYLDSKTLSKAISSLRNHLKLSPQMIIVNK